MASNRINLLDAASRGDVDAVRRALATPGVEVDVWGSMLNSTPLIAAAEGGHEEVVEMLLGRGAEVNARYRWIRYRGMMTMM